MFKRSYPLLEGTPGVSGTGELTPATTVDSSALAPEPKPASEFIPEKFRVLNGEALDVEASARKMAESYGQLEARFSGGDIPPKTADEYVVTVPDAFKEHWQDDDRSKAFKTDALAAGITQKQFDFVMDRYFKVAPELVAGSLNNSVEAVKGSLQKAWGEGEKYDAAFNAAYTAFQAYADPADKGRFDEIVRDPSLAYRILAKIGPELREAGGVIAGADGGQEADIKTLLTSEAANNPRHADYKTVRAKLDNYYNKKYGTAPVL